MYPSISNMNSSIGVFGPKLCMRFLYPDAIFFAFLTFIDLFSIRILGEECNFLIMSHLESQTYLSCLRLIHFFLLPRIKNTRKIRVRLSEESKTIERLRCIFVLCLKTL